MSNIFNQVTLYIYDIFIISLLYERNIVELSGFFLATILPALITMFTGFAFDKYDRKTILTFVNIFKIILNGFLLFSQNVILIYIITFINGCLMEITSNGNALFVKQIVDDSELKPLLAKQNFINAVAIIIGPVVAGIIIAYFSKQNFNTSLIIVVIMEVCLFLATILLQLISTKPILKKNKSITPRSNINFRKFDINIIYITLMWCIFMFVIGMCSPLEVKFIQSILNMDVQYYAFGNSIEGIGNLVVSIFLMIYIKKINIGDSIKLGLIISSLAYLIIGISSNMYIYSIGAILVGVAAGIIPFSFKMFFQVNVDDRILGRVYSSARFLVLLSRMFGLFFVSVLLNLLDIRTMYFVISAICVLLIIIINIFEKRNIKKKLIL